MAWLALASTVLSAASASNQAAESAQAVKIAGIKQASSENQEAIQLDASAQQDRAAAEQEALDRRRQIQIKASRANAIASASGANSIDPSVVNIMAGYDQESDYAANAALYSGEQSARSKDYAAMLKRQGARDSITASGITAKGYQTAGQNQAASSILTGASQYAKYR